MDGQQAGLPAVTFTGGAGTVPAEGVRTLATDGRPVTILYDHDDEGRSGAQKAARALREAGVEVLVRRHVGLPPGGDLTDLYGTVDRDDAALRETVAELPVVEEGGGDRDLHPDEDAASEDHVTLDQFRAYLPEHKYIFVPSRDLWPSSSVNARLPKVNDPDSGQEVNASTFLDKHQSVEQMTWAPGSPLLIKDRLIANGGWVEFPGVTCFNLYREPQVELGDASRAGPWLEHVHRVYPAHADQLIAEWAHRVQRPGEKINHAQVLGGLQGIGKDTALEPVKYAVAPWNFIEVSPAQLLGRFNGFTKSVVLRVSEARDLGDVDRYSFYEHMKAYAAAPPDVLRVDEKHRQEYSVVNVCFVIITTNHKSAGIYLPADDRRHYVAWSDLRKDDFPADYWSKLWAWYEDGGLGHVAAYLHELDISDFDPKAPPPKTTAFWDIVDANRAPEDAELADALDRLDNPDAVTLEQIVKVADEAFAEWLTDRRNRRQIPHRMESADYEAIRNDTAKDGLWKVRGRRQVVYGRRDLAVRDRITAVNELIRDGR